MGERAASNPLRLLLSANAPMERTGKPTICLQGSRLIRDTVLRNAQEARGAYHQA